MNKYLIFAFFLIPFTACAASLESGVVSPNETVSAQTTITFNITNTGFLNTPKYTLSDSFPGSTLANSNINSYGTFNWTPSILDIGTHTVVITGSDTYGNKGTITKNLVVKEASPVTINSLSPSSTVFPDDTVTFNVSAFGYTNPLFYVSDSFGNTSITGSNINSWGNFSWKPKTTDVGVHNITARVVNGYGRTDTAYQTITVNGFSVVNNSGSTLRVGSPLSLTITSYGLNNPSYRVTDDLRNNTIDTGVFNGNTFNWVPSSQDIGVHNITINGTDSNGKNLSSSIRITVESNVQTTVTPSASAPVVKPATFTFTAALKFGSNGKEVVELQKRLLAEGYFNGPTNGNFGPLTKAAVIKYQKAKKLSPIGIVGPGTRAALNKK